MESLAVRDPRICQVYCKPSLVPSSLFLHTNYLQHFLTRAQVHISVEILTFTQNPEGFIKSTRWLTFKMPIFLQRWQSQDAFTATKAVPQAQLLSLCGCSISPKVRYLSSVPSVHQKTDTCFTPGNLFHPRMALQEAVGEGNRDVCRAGTHCPDKLRVTGTDLISLTADTNTFWNLIQHRRELHHFRLHWSLNTSKHPCLKRTTLTAPNPRTSIYLWIGK